ncbi:D-alanine--D-alanine ligase, partial [bacterium]|nr:D-alanine--D-alanine ligase [bacterium]
VDVRLDKKGVPRFLEVNPLPGLSPKKGDIVILANAVGISYRDLIGRILNEAFSRNHLAG